MSSKPPRNKLLRGNVYNSFPELYDLLYRRYLKSIPDFINLVGKNTPKNGTVLDMAAGTGEVTIPLLKKNYQVSSLDMHRGMLKELRRKVQKGGLKNHATIFKDMNLLTGKNKFDTICIRQAINYYKNPKSLEKGIKKVFSALKDTGSFIFNAPNFKIGTKKFKTVHTLYENTDLNVFVVETNTLKGRVLTHNQNTILWGSSINPKFVSDSNSFYMYTKEEFEHALIHAGFRKIRFFSSGLIPYRKDDKTLYCVATK